MRKVYDNTKSLKKIVMFPLKTIDDFAVDGIIATIQKWIRFLKSNLEK